MQALTLAITGNVLTERASTETVYLSVSTTSDEMDWRGLGEEAWRRNVLTKK